MKRENSCNFTFEHYRRVFKDALVKGYVISKLKDYNDNIRKKNVIFLRHDVDFDIELALRLAKVEHELGIHSTYFVRIHANYNLFSYNNYTSLKKIINMGHEIGLHHESGFSNLFNESEIDMIRKEKVILESIANCKVKGISLHEPSRVGSKPDPKWFDKLGFEYNAYSRKFINDIKYISDSSARWREGCMCNFIKSKEPKLCILIHPFWWYNLSPLQNY